MTTDLTADPVTRSLIAYRKVIAWAMIAVGLASVGGVAFSASKLMGGSSAAAEKVAGEDQADEPAVTPPVAHRAEYTVGVLCGVMGAIAGLGVGAWILAAPPRTAEAERGTEARVAALTAGGTVGLVLMVGGLAFFVVWFGLLVKWLDDRVPPPGAWKVVAALLVFLIGAGLTFLAALPARAEERSNPTLRRLVYGLNFGLGSLLMLVVLVAGNAVAALKMPAKLDTTESGFYTLSDATKEYLATLTQPVTAYSTLPDSSDRDILDARRLLAAMQAVNPQMFQVRHLSLALNRAEIESLRAKYPQVDFQTQLGVLLTTGEDGERYAFVRLEEMVSQEFDQMSSAPRLVFQGEAKVVRELLSLTEAKAKAIVYFTQNSGELALASVPEADPRRGATRLKEALERGNAEVRPLAFGPGEAKVPDDASAVVVADPVRPLPEAQAEAIRQFVTAARPDGKKGTLVLLAGPHPDPDGKVAATGLEPLLTDLQIRLGEGFLYNYPLGQYGPTTALVGVRARLVDSRNPVAMAAADRVMTIDDVRLVTPNRGFGGPGPTAEALMMTAGGRPTWVETTRTDPIRALEQMLEAKDADLARRKEFTDSSRPVAAIVSEGETPRAVVFGFGDYFADPTGRRASPVPAELFAASVNWLRERPAVANIANKTYGLYTLNRAASEVPLFWLPVGITLTGVLALGLGVWLLRRM